MNSRIIIKEIQILDALSNIFLEELVICLRLEDHSPMKNTKLVYKSQDFLVDFIQFSDVFIGAEEVKKHAGNYTDKQKLIIFSIENLLV